MRKLLYILFILLPLGVFGQLNTDRLTNIGRNALYFEDYVLSIQYFNQVIKSKPFLSDAYFYRAIAKIQLEDYVGAERDLNKVIDLNPFIPMSYYARGFSRRRLGKLEGASEDFSKALLYSPENPLYIVNRIDVYEQLGRYEETIKDIDFLIRRSPREGGLYVEKGRLLLSSGDTLGAVPMFKKGVELDRYNSELWGALGYIMMVVDNQDSALISYDKAVELSSRNISTYINRGILNYHKKKYRDALSDYDKAVQLDPYNMQALYNRALLRYEVGDYHTSLADLTKIIDKHHLPSAYQMRVYVNEKLGNEEQAESDKKVIAEMRKAWEEGESFDSLKVGVQIANTYNSSITSKSAIFLANLNNEDLEEEGDIKGAVQNKKINVTNENSFQLSYYYFKTMDLPRQTHISREVQDFNDMKRLSGPIYIVNKEVPLSRSLIDYHFSSIGKYSEKIDNDPMNADYYLNRAMDYVLVKDFSNAINDYSKAIFYGVGDMSMVYFMRANVRYKMIEASENKLAIEDNLTSSNFGKNGNNLNNMSSVSKVVAEKKYALEYEMVMRDYDKVIEISPEFPYSWFNKANLLSLQKDYTASIMHYSKAIEIDPDFGEAYFNRALVYILQGKEEEAIFDLSKAGELGVFQAYSIIKRLK